MARIDTTACAKMVTDVAARCSAPAAAPIHDAAPNFDSLASSIAFGSLVIMVVTLVVVFAGIIVAIQWARGVVAEAKESASKEVKEMVPALTRAYLEERVPGLVAENLAATRGGGSPEEQAEALGGDPR